MQTSIEIDGKKYEIEGGLIRAHAIYEVVGGTGECLFMRHSHGIDIPLDFENVLLIQGNEVFVTGERPHDDNPPLTKPVQILFNGKPGQALPKAKITGRELKNFDDDLPQGRLFVDIGTGPDAEITDEMAILVQESNAFFVIPGTNEGDPVDIEECAQHGRRPPKGQEVAGHMHCSVSGVIRSINSSRQKRNHPLSSSSPSPSVFQLECSVSVLVRCSVREAV